MMLYDMTGAQMPMITQDNYGKWYYLYRAVEYPNKGFGMMYYYRRDNE